MKKLVSLILIFSLIIVSQILISPKIMAQSVSEKNILYFNSYHSGYKWSDDIYNGIKSGLDIVENRINLEVEYMDTQRNSDEQYIDKLVEMYITKYQASNYDVIISSDDAAFDFLLKYKDQIFKDTPIVFCGVNYLDENKLVDHFNYTGVVEGYDIESTVNVALALHPGVNKIYYITGESLTSKSIQKEHQKVVEKFSTLEFERIDGNNLSEIDDKVKKIDENSIILYYIYFQAKDGSHYVYNEAIEKIEKSSSMPIYGVWDFNLGYGINGGKLISGYNQGNIAANMVLQILNGTSASDIAVVAGSETEYQFDNDMLLKFDIDLDKLPSDSTIINLNNSTKKQVLILNSYSKGMKWTDDIELGLKSVFTEKEDDIEFYYEYMDVKRNSETLYIQNISEFLKDNINFNKYDAIVTTDDDAYKFMSHYHNIICEEVPVIFCGVNYLDELTLNSESFSGVEEAYDLKSTIDIAIDLNSQLNKIIVINDNTLTGLANKKNVEDIIPLYSDKVSFEFWEDINMIEVQNKVKKLDENTIILLMTFNKDKSFNNYSYEESIKLISKDSAVPIYGVWDFYLGDGLIGGMLTSGFTQGEEAGRLLYNTLFDDQLVITSQDNSTNHYMFDYLQLEKFNIATSKLPDNSIIINQPDSLVDIYNDNKDVLKAFALLIVIILSLILIVVLLYKNNRIKKINIKHEEKLAMTDELTGILNRRAGLRFLDDIVSKNENGNQILTVCFIDINNLKLVNDHYGHTEGDELIKVTTKIISSCIRENDTFCRFGGDEFLIIFPNTNQEIANKVYNRIIEEINNFNLKEKKKYLVSISGGFSEYNQYNIKTADELINEADSEMYDNKALFKKNNQQL